MKTIATHLFCRGSITKSELLKVTPTALEKFGNPEYRREYKKVAKKYGKRGAYNRIMSNYIDMPAEFLYDIDQKE